MKRPAASQRRKPLPGTDLVEAAALLASFLCLVHCLALPLLLAMLPAVLGVFAASAAFHLVALGLIVPAALAAFMQGYRRHHVPAPAVLGITGLVLLGVAILPPVGRAAETALTIAASLFLVAGHTLNWCLRRVALRVARETKTLG